MSETMRFLESAGSNPNRLTAEAYAAAVARLDIDADERRALLEHDVAALSRALGGRMAMQLVLVPAEDDDDGPQPDDDRDTEEVRSLAS